MSIPNTTQSAVAITSSKLSANEKKETENFKKDLKLRLFIHLFPNETF